MYYQWGGGGREKEEGEGRSGREGGRGREKVPGRREGQMVEILEAWGREEWRVGCSEKV